jgi:hypothetical protein
MARSLVYIDGENLGRAPIYNKYLNFGRHVVTASNDRFEGTDTIYIMPNDDKKSKVFNVEMHNISNLFGDVKVTVDNKADIYFEGALVGTGSWSTQLREGNYTVETRKADCDSVRSTFQVKRQQMNEFKAAPPIPHSGQLRILPRPITTTLVLDGTTLLQADETITVPVGTHAVTATQKGYVEQTKEYEILYNELTSDTLTMEEISYVKPSAFYLGGGVTAATLGGYTAMIGMVLGNNDFQASYTFGSGESGTAQWSNQATGGAILSRVSYKMNTMAFKYGYQVRLIRRMSLVPQVGYAYNQLKANLKSGSKNYGDGESSQCVTIGAKLLFVPFMHCYLFAMPEIGIPVSKSEMFDNIAKAAGFSTTTLGVTAGIILNF